MDFAVGEKVHMKKTHACGCPDWQILRVGADFRIACLKCGRQVMLSRHNFEKSVRKKIPDNEVNS